MDGTLCSVDGCGYHTLELKYSHLSTLLFRPNGEAQFEFNISFQRQMKRMTCANRAEHNSSRRQGYKLLVYLGGCLHNIIKSYAVRCY